MSDVFSVTISPPTETWRNVFLPRMLTLCEKLSKKDCKVLYSEEIGDNSTVGNHGHMYVQRVDRGKNLKRQIEGHFKQYFDELRMEAKGQGQNELAQGEWNHVLKCKRHDDPLKLIGYVTKDWKEGATTLQSWNNLEYDDEWIALWKRARDYHNESSIGQIKGWKCKGVNAIFDFAVEWVKKNTPKEVKSKRITNVTKAEDGSANGIWTYQQQARKAGWEWDNGVGDKKCYRKYPDWNKVISRLHTNGEIPTSLAVKVLRKEYRILWEDYWINENPEDWVSHQREFDD